MMPEEANITIDYLKEMQEGYIEGEGYERHPLPEWYALDKAIEVIEQTTWIPCNEKLPEKSGNYWCTFGETNLTGSDHYTTESDAKETFDDAAEKYVGWKSQNVVAWMPQPKPYESQKVIKQKAGTPREDYTPLYNCENWIP